MEIFGTTIQNIFLLILILSSLLTILFIFFGDYSAMFTEITPLLNPVLILLFTTFTSASALILELVSFFSIYIIIILAISIGLVLTSVLYYFVFIPLKSKEDSTSYLEQSLKGKIGKVVLAIPSDGFGEVMMETRYGLVIKPAASFKQVEISKGESILVIQVQNGVLYVVPFESIFDSVLE